MSNKEQLGPIRPIDGIIKGSNRLPGRWRKVRFHDEVAPKEICVNTPSEEEQKEMDRAVEVAYEDEDRNLKKESEPTGAKEEKEDKPFWEKRRGVAGESGPSVGGGVRKGAQSFPEPGSGTTEGGKEDSEEVEAEGRQPNMLCSPCEPTVSEICEHQVAAHLPFRNWCKICIDSKGT